MGKKKMTKEERKRFEAEKAEALRVEMEKERQRQLEEERQLKLKQLTEAKERKKREKGENKFRRVQLAESCEFFKNVRNEIADIYEERRKLREWKRYMRCGLPNAYDPGDLRTYIHMWQLENDQYNANEQNWLLRTDERTILTQNRNVLNVTRINLQQQQPILGDMYAKRTQDILGILDEIDEAIYEPSSLSKSIIDELHCLKLEFRQKLSQYIDDFSFKILSNIDRDMKLEGLLIATHFYECDVFKVYLWTKRDIPMPLLNEKERQKESKNYISIEFASLQLHLCLPPTVKCKNGAIRGMWLKYDHYSDYSPSYEMPNRTVCNLDLNQSTKIEWKKRKELECEASIEPSKLKSHKNLSSIDGTVPFDHFELMCTPIVDVDKLYLDYVTDRMRTNRQRRGVRALNLKEFEINLRQYRIVGGIYSIEYFEQPEQSVKLSSKTYLRTVTGPKTLKRRQFFQYFRAPDPTPAGVRRLPEEVETEMKMVERGLSKLAYITIKLPEDIIWFEPPTVCRWETIEETDVSEKIENKPIQISKQKSLKSTSDKFQRTEIVIVDFNLLHIPPKIDINVIMLEVIVPRIPDGYTVTLSDISPRRNSLVIQPISPQSNDVKGKCIESVKDFLLSTDSPRPLYPKLTTTLQVKVIEKKGTSHPQNQKEYLLSQLLQDLDDLRTKQFPQIERQMEEICEMLSTSIVDEHEVDSVIAESQIDEEYTWGLLKKPEPIKESNEPPSDESDDDDLADINSEIETIVVNDRSGRIIGRWSARDVHDPKFNEEKLSIQFRAGRLGCFGLAVNWYANLPFQTWECKPDFKIPDSIFYSLTAAVVSIEITITKDGIYLQSFQGGTSPLIQDSSGKLMSFIELKELLYSTGINLFPDEDAFCYCEALCERDAVMESHLYECIAHMGLTHNFMWSRWNNQQNSRSVVLLVRELIEKRKPPTFSTLFVTPLKACLVECTEVAPSFSSTPLAEMNEFYADLYHLGKEISQPVSIAKQNSMDPLLRDNFLKVLKATRPLSTS